jgi:hypothetical protein
MFPALPPDPSPEEQARAAHGYSPEQLYGYAAQLLGGGAQPDAVRQKLLELGLDEKTASTVVHDLLAAPGTVPADIVRPPSGGDWSREVGRRRMAVGALVFFIGLIVTVATFAAAAGGGTYIVAWGAMLYGVIEFLRGASMSSGQ